MTAEAMKTLLSKTKLSFKICLQCLWKQILSVMLSLLADFTEAIAQCPGKCMWLLLWLSPTRWNVKHILFWTLGDSHVWWRDRDVQPWRLTPHTLLHNSTHPFFIPLLRIPFSKCVSSWMAVGGALGPWGYQVSFKKAVVRTGWEWSMTLFRLNCSQVKTVWPRSALPALEWPFLYSSKKSV